MLTISGLLRKVRAFNTNAAIDTAMEQATPFIKNELRKQLYAGYNGDGELIGETRPYQNVVYAEVKHRMNPEPGEGNPDLYVTGQFYGGVKVEYEGNNIMSTSTDEKAPELMEKYPGALRLGGPFKQGVIDHNIRPVFNGEVTKAIGLPFGPLTGTRTLPKP